MSSTLKPIVLLFDQIGVVVCFVVMSWQRLQLVLCHINNFTAKYQALTDNYVCHISLILFDFLEEL